MYKTITLTRPNDTTLYLTLNQPDTRNALSAEMIAELTDFAQSAHQRPERVIVLAGTGKIFCAGGDLKWMKAQINADRETRIAEARKLADMLRALNEIPKPVIARVHGGAFGGGIGMMSVCDYVVAESDAKFGLTETRLGLIPATIGPYVVARLGEGMTRRVFMSPKILDAETAKELGLVAEYGDTAFLDEVIKTQEKAYAHAAPDAIASAKRLTQSLSEAISAEKIELSIQALADTWENPEAAEGINAFFEKRKASWVLETDH